MSELLIGCGNRREKVAHKRGNEAWTDLTTLDIDPACGADVIHDLDVLPYPFADDSFDEIHASEVLEHCGRQGDWRFFFGQFSEFWRILRPDGLFAASCPSSRSPWAWADPGHTRVLLPETLHFLAQPSYAEVGDTAMTDYRDVWSGDFDVINATDDGAAFRFVLRAVKPARKVAV